MRIISKLIWPVLLVIMAATSALVTLVLVRKEAMVRAIDWAIENELDVLTYSTRPFSPQGRERLDPRCLEAAAAVRYVKASNEGKTDTTLADTKETAAP